jgi:hypothetical protein
VALWLEPRDPDSGGTSLLMSLDPVPSGLSAFVLHSTRDVLSVIREQAQAAMSATASSVIVG